MPYTAIIADDEKLICDAIQSVLNMVVEDLEITQVFHDGAEAYDYLQSHSADILLLDIEMPKKTGLDIAKLVDQQKCGSYVIIITAYHEFDYAKKAIEYNVNDFLTKPFSSQQLVDAVNKGLSVIKAAKSSSEYSHKALCNLLQTLCTHDNFNQAKKILTEYVQSLTIPELEMFAAFLADNYHISLADTDTETIIHDVENMLKDSLSTNSGNHIVNAAFEYIHKHFTSNALSLESAADALSVSNAYLSRLFKKHTNQNFSEYLLSVRMDHAKQLLKTTNMTTTKIANAIGYDNTAYFRSSFKAYYGMTPKQYRQFTNRKDNDSV